MMGIDLMHADGSLTMQGMGAVAGTISAAVCYAMYKASRYISPMFSKSYSTLSKDDQINWDSRPSSNVHTAICVYYAYEMLARSDFFWKDGPIPMILRSNETTHIALGITFGYFLVDLALCIKYNLGGTTMLLHHIGSVLSVGTALATGGGHMHTLWMLITEFTTPLINNRWWLDKMDMKAHKMYVINGLAIVFSWIFARLAIFPPFFHLVWKTRDQMVYINPLMRALLLTVPAILTSLNCFWFYKIVKGAIKVLWGPKTDKKEE